MLTRHRSRYKYSVPVLPYFGSVKHIPTACELVDRLAVEYEAAKAELALKTSFTAGRVLLAAE